MTTLLDEVPVGLTAVTVDVKTPVVCGKPMNSPEAFVWLVTKPGMGMTAL